MPIPMPPPPAPYVAPDLHPIVARDSARLTFVRDEHGRLVTRALDHGIWIAADGAPLELRFHKRPDGSVWAEQATYVDGDRGDATARRATAAHTEVISLRAVAGLAMVRAFAAFTIRGADGSVLRHWTTSLCGSGSSLARLDRDGSPSDPTFPTTWDSCDAGGHAPYVLGRLVALDRGWSMPASSSVGALKPLPPGRYTLELDVDPLDALADADRSNDHATVPLIVANAVEHSDCCEELPGPGGGTMTPTMPGAGATRSTATHALARGRREPGWYVTSLARLEAHVADVAPPEAPPADVDLPDLRSAPSYGIGMRVGHSRALGARDLLDFGALEWNAGPGPVEVEAFRESGTTLHAFQVFYRDGRRVSRQARGTLIWHAAPGHNHFHFNSFALYQLTRPDGSIVRDSGKHSWCIVDTDSVDTTRPGVAGSSSTGSSYGGCGTDPGSLWARLGLSVGAGDYYGPGIAGQTFDVTAVPNGRYLIRIEVNPLRVIAETDTSNNVATREVTLGGGRGARTVVATPVPTIDERGFQQDPDCKVC